MWDPPFPALLASARTFLSAVLVTALAACNFSDKELVVLIEEKVNVRYRRPSGRGQAGRPKSPGNAYSIWMEKIA